MHVPVKELSDAIRSALASVSYGASDIRVEPSRSADGSVAGGAGQRGFCIAVNLDTGARKGVTGSWGGANPWSSSPVDDHGQIVEIPDNGAIIKGTTGYPRTFATIYVSPQAMGRMLPSGEPAEELSDADQQALYCYKCIKGGEYRREEMRRRNVSDATVDSLVSREYLKRAKNGATQITTKGKNAATIRY